MTACAPPGGGRAHPANLGSEAVRVVVVVLNHNGLDHLAYCLPSVLATEYEAFSVLMVDNGSSDSSAAIVRERHPEVEVMRLDHNAGWAAGHNAGLRTALDHRA